MFYSERHDQILELLQKEKTVSVHKLARELSISESSIRRDLTALESIGKVRRFFGGAVLSESTTHEVSLQYRRSQNLQAKKQIAKKALDHIRDGMMIFLDASSTAAQLIPYLERFADLTVVTNSPQAAISLAELKINCLCTGGRLLSQSMAFVGGSAIGYLDSIQPDVAFFSCRGLSEDGILSDSLEEEVELRRAILRNARYKVFLCDSSKRGKSYPYRLCHLDDVDRMIQE